MNKEKKSFFERLTGSIKADKETSIHSDYEPAPTIHQRSDWIADEQVDGELTVDVYQNEDEIVIQTMVAGVRPEDLDISITRDMVTLKGKRESVRDISEENYFHRELYWGSFSRTILLPEEIDVEASEASEKYGLLTIKLPKVDKNKQTKLRVKAN